MSTPEKGQYFPKGNAIIVGKQTDNDKVITDGLIVYHAKALSSTEPWFLQDKNQDKRPLNSKEPIYILGHKTKNETISGLDMSTIAEKLVKNFNYTGHQEVFIMTCNAKKSNMATKLKSVLESLLDSILESKEVTVMSFANYSSVIVECINQAYAKDISYPDITIIIQKRILKKLNCNNLIYNLTNYTNDINDEFKDYDIKIATYCYSLLERGTNILDRFINRLTFYTFGFITILSYSFIWTFGNIWKNAICLNILSYSTYFDKQAYLILSSIGIVTLLALRHKKIFVIMSSILVNYSIFSYLILTNNIVSKFIPTMLCGIGVYTIAAIVDTMIVEFTGALQEY